MASNVFGNPITNQTLEAMPKYQGKETTAVHKAYEAPIMKNIDNEDVNARKFVESLKPKYNVVVTTTCLICIATGKRLTFVGSNDWQGHVGDSPYPLLLENGQWVHFFMSRIFHRLALDPLQLLYIMVIMRMEMLLNGCWLGTIQGIECSTADHYEGMDWNIINDDKLSMLDRYSSDTWNGCYSSVIAGYPDVMDVKTTNRICPIFEGTMTLKNTWIQ
ncbi:hypothetical protein FEM48_Zijuj11G0156400 [Ziziphus jujuba var. spinosa]|uniref:Uncharacterized protein n=1 Tax=Ziziphus jujuba var. spinosa TaxID=714518 RepID=A0A978UJT3_ZIZJJ|nr:hypothetical protein FEM48_Zijuj11G0156400 [Ziziphus jujuba var. spinosa]